MNHAKLRRLVRCVISEIARETEGEKDFQMLLVSMMRIVGEEVACTRAESLV